MREFFRSHRPLVLALGLLVVYAWQVEPRLLTVRRLEIKDSALARAWPGLTIVHLADTHIKREGGREARLLARIREIGPDLILMSGDYRQWREPPGPAQHFLAQLSAPLGVYGVLGDSDQDQGPSGCAYCHPDGRYGDRLSTPVILRNEMRTLPWRGGQVTVVGIEQDESGRSLPNTLAQQTKAAGKDEPLLILCHQSGLWRNFLFTNHSLWLSGDAHGGQIWLPAWLWRLLPFKPDPAHMGGLYHNGRGGWLLVNRGVGETARFPFRLGVLPEICVITFTGD